MSAKLIQRTEGEENGFPVTIKEISHFKIRDTCTHLFFQASKRHFPFTLSLLLLCLFRNFLVYCPPIRHSDHYHPRHYTSSAAAQFNARC